MERYEGEKNHENFKRVSVLKRDERSVETTRERKRQDGYGEEPKSGFLL
jgi:hypothetical protein